jgi:prepilin-type N-terminal cleavage/methylation domain-containing protein
MKQRGFTLMELMVTMTVAALIFSVVLDVWHVSSVNQKHLLTKTQSFANTTSVLDIIEREARQAIRFEIKTSTSGKSLYTFVMPANRDANNNFTPVRTGNGLVYQEGQQVQYYLSNTTGSPTANGNILWRATAPAGSSVFTPDTTWSMRNTTQPRYPTLQTFAISTYDAWGTQIAIDARTTESAGARSASYTGREVVSLVNNNGMQVVFPLDSRASFYRTNLDPDAQPPLVLDLVSLNINEGDRIRLDILGHFSYWNNSNPATDVSSETCFVFSRTNTVLGVGNLLRIPDVVASSAPPYTTTTTWLGNLATNIDGDFGTSGSMEVTVPTNARYLMVCTFDGFYGDNRDLDRDYKLRITKLK